MKKTLLTVFGILLISSCFGQDEIVVETSNDREILKKVLSDIDNSFETKSLDIKEKANELDKKVIGLDIAIAESKSSSDKANKLLERVQALEEKQITVEENELNVFGYNYQSAVVNLASMKREIQPLVLFNSTREFFSTLTETSNPMNYPGYQDWYQNFEEYMNKKKKRNASLNVLSSLITLTGDLSEGAPFTGPIADQLFTGIATFINSLGGGKKELQEKSRKMFELTAKVAQFAHDKDLIEQEWSSITTELEELKKNYDEVLEENLKLLNVRRSDFDTQYARHGNGKTRHEFLKSLEEKSKEFVFDQKNTNEEKWKEEIYFQMMDVQALKYRLGRITFRISENFASYQKLIDKYKNDPQIGAKVGTLESKLSNLKTTFDDGYNPLDYINEVSRMYKVQ